MKKSAQSASQNQQILSARSAPRSDKPIQAKQEQRYRQPRAAQNGGNVKKSAVQDLVKARKNETLAIIEDVDNGHEFYVSMVDKFVFANRQYVAMSVFDPEASLRDEPEFVLMRFDISDTGEHYYQSIRNKKELDAVFDCFFDRYVKLLSR